MWASYGNADTNSGGLAWDLRFCIPNGLPRDADVAGGWIYVELWSFSDIGGVGKWASVFNINLFTDVALLGLSYTCMIFIESRGVFLTVDKLRGHAGLIAPWHVES